jgi:hypothetical protein
MYAKGPYSGSFSKGSTDDASVDTDSSSLLKREYDFADNFRCCLHVFLVETE